METSCVSSVWKAKGKEATGIPVADEAAVALGSGKKAPVNFTVTSVVLGVMEG